MNLLTIRRLICLLWCSTFFCPGVSVSTDPAQPVNSPPPLSSSHLGFVVLEGSDTEISGLGTARYNFGTRSTLDQAPIEHIFVLQSASKWPFAPIGRLKVPNML